MRIAFIAVFLFPAVAADRVSYAVDPVEAKELPLWQPPMVEHFQAADVKLIARPETSRHFALQQVAGEVPDANYVPTNPTATPYIADEDLGYRLVEEGLKKGVRCYGDRKYAINNVDEVLSGLTLLQTKMGNKSIADAKYSIVLSVDKPSYVFIALDERVLETYQQNGLPSWLQEYARTPFTISTDDPIMSRDHKAYLVFVRKVPAGRIALGPPCMGTEFNAMYFAFFADAE